MHRVLREALEQAVKWNALTRNPAGLVKPPRVERKQMAVLDPAGTADIIEEARNYTFFIPIVLAVLCGVRRGEIAALRWRSLDLDAGQLSVVASIEQTRAGCREKDAKSGADVRSPSPLSWSRSCGGTGSRRRRQCWRSACG